LKYQSFTADMLTNVVVRVGGRP